MQWGSDGITRIMLPTGLSTIEISAITFIHTYTHTHEWVSEWVSGYSQYFSHSVTAPLTHCSHLPGSRRQAPNITSTCQHNTVQTRNKMWISSLTHLLTYLLEWRSGGVAQWHAKTCCYARLLLLHLAIARCNSRPCVRFRLKSDPNPQ